MMDNVTDGVPHMALPAGGNKRLSGVRDITSVDDEVEFLSPSLVDDLLKRFRVSVVVPKARIH